VKEAKRQKETTGKRQGNRKVDYQRGLCLCAWVCEGRRAAKSWVWGCDAVPQSTKWRESLSNPPVVCFALPTLLRCSALFLPYHHEIPPAFTTLCAENTVHTGRISSHSSDRPV
jgi:hypothetical protein